MNDKRYTVTPVHKQNASGGWDVAYWRVVDGETDMRANGTAKYETAEQAQRWCDALNND